MRPPMKSILAIAALLAAACGADVVIETPSATPTSAAAHTTTSSAAATTGSTPIAEEALDATEPEPAEPESEPAETGTTETAPTEPEPTETAPTEPEGDEPGSPAMEPAGAEGVGDSLYPRLGNGGYDVLHYSIVMNVENDLATISALASITARATEDLSEFNLDLSGLDVETVVIVDLDVSEEAEAEITRSGTELTVRPARTLAEGTTFTAKVRYSGSPRPIEEPGMPFFPVGWQSRDGVIYTASQPSGSMTWFPSNNHPSDKATFELSITVPEPLVAASNGVLLDETTSGGRTTFRWRMDDPMAPYLAAVYVGDFERVEHGPLYEGGPLIRDYVPRYVGPAVTEALSVTPDAIRFMEDLLGPYPFDAYGTIVMPFDLGFALENQTLSLHGPSSIGPGVIAHEAAHQWLGNSVALEDWNDIWLNEGFATYLHLMFEAEHFGADPDAFNASMERLHARLTAIGTGPPGMIGIEDLFGFSVYYRGAMTLHALRLHAGDEAFFKILRVHYDRSAGDTTNTAEFLGIVGEFADPEAVALVESWLYDETVPAAV